MFLIPTKAGIAWLAQWSGYGLLGATDKRLLFSAFSRLHLKNTQPIQQQKGLFTVEISERGVKQTNHRHIPSRRVFVHLYRR